MFLESHVVVHRLSLIHIFIQEVSRNLDEKYSFAKLVELARQDQFAGIFDVNDERFLKPESMIFEIKQYFQERHETAPQTVGQIASCVYHSLAYGYKKAIEELEMITKQTYPCLLYTSRCV